MRASLWFKLMGILSIIILTGVLVMIVVVNYATASQFRRFVRTSDVTQAQNLSTLLADYYARQGSWQGVESLFTTASVFRTDTMGGMMGRGMMEHVATQPEMMQEMFDMMRGSASFIDRAVLADAEGLVVADSADILIGQRHSDEHPSGRASGRSLAAGAPIIVQGQEVGTVLVGSMIEPVLNPLDEDFLRSVKLAVFLSALTVGAVALALGSFFFFQITAPVRDLTQATEAIAAGNLDQRVNVRSSDEIGRLAQAFNTMADGLARAETLRRQMVADIAHELRTPIGLIQGNLEAILDGMYELDLENVASVHEETLVLSRLVNDLRDLTLVEAGQLQLEKEVIEPAILVTQAVDRFRVQACEQEVSLDADLSPDLPPIRGDGQRLSRVLLNLLSNALRYTPSGGCVTVVAKLVSREQSAQTGGKVRTPGENEQASQLLLISVVDTGQGIPPEALPYVFERFYRADKSRARASGGSGLGLAIALQIIEAHGGQIWASSPGRGQGSTFSFTLPVIS